MFSIVVVHFCITCQNDLLFCTDTPQDQSTPQGDSFPRDENVVAAEASPSTTPGVDHPQGDETGVSTEACPSRTQADARPQADETVSGVAEASPSHGNANAGDPCQSQEEGCQESACI